MSTVNVRRSDRVNLELAIQLSGVNAAGGRFVEQGHTAVVSRHGAKVACYCVLMPQQAVTVRCHRTGMETVARVVGQIGHEDGKTFYGMEFSDPLVDIWGIEFPPLAEAESAAGRVLLECLSCHNLEIAHLDAFALEVLVANQCLMRPCSRCIDRRISVWKQPPEQGLEIPPVTHPPAATGAGTQQQKPCIALKTEVCIRHLHLGEEVAMTEGVSRGAFRFHSHRCYDVGAVISAALPYSPGAANVFALARIESAETVAALGTFLYSAVYTVAEVSSLRASHPSKAQAA